MRRTLFLRFVPCLVALTSFVALTGCENTIPSGASYVVSVPKAAFYKYGPAQSFGPDFMLDEDTRVTILQHSMGFSRVSTNTGLSGYISNDDLKPAPPAPPTPQESAAAYRKLNQVFSPNSPKQKRGGSDLQPTPGSPLVESGDLSPLPENNESKPSPRFRF